MHDDPQEGLLQPSNNTPGVIPANGPLVFQEQKIGGGRNYKEAWICKSEQGWERKHLGPNLHFQDWFCFLSYDSSVGRSSLSVKAVGMGTAQQPARPGNKKLWSKPERWAWVELAHLRATPCRKKRLRWQIRLQDLEQSHEWNLQNKESTSSLKLQMHWLVLFNTIWWSQDRKIKVLTMSKSKKTSKPKKLWLHKILHEKDWVFFPHYSA